MKRLVIAVLVVGIIAVFLGLNMYHQAELWLFRETQVSTLVLFGVAFFAGAATTFLTNMRGHHKKHRRLTSEKTRQMVSLKHDEDL
jgi:undecaprenyl pyrophosphate phosphatase UppP